MLIRRKGGEQGGTTIRNTLVGRTEQFTLFSIIKINYKKCHTGYIKIKRKILFLYGEAKNKTLQNVNFLFLIF